MKSPFAAFASLVVVIGVVLAIASAMFTVGQTQQALVLRFGEPRTLVKDPGLP